MLRGIVKILESNWVDKSKPVISGITKQSKLKENCVHLENALILHFLVIIDEELPMPCNGMLTALTGKSNLSKKLETMHED